MEYKEKNSERIRHEWKRRSQDLLRTPFITEDEAAELIRSRRRPQSWRKRIACFCSLIATSAASATFMLLLVRAWQSSSQLATIACVLLLAATLCLCAATAYELFLLLMMHRNRFLLSAMDTYLLRYQRLMERRSRWLRFVHYAPKAPGTASLRPRIAFATTYLALLAGVAAWRVSDNHRSASAPLLASSHTSRQEAAPAKVSPTALAPNTIASVQPVSALVTAEASVNNAGSIPSALVAEKAQLAEETLAEFEPSRMQECIADADGLLPEEEQTAEPNVQHKDSRLASISVTCNRGNCTEQKYYDLFCAIVTNKN